MNKEGLSLLFTAAQRRGRFYRKIQYFRSQNEKKNFEQIFHEIFVSRSFVSVCCIIVIGPLCRFHAR